MDFTKLTVGEKVCVPTHKDEVTFDLTPGGAVLMMQYNGPSATEKRNVKSGVTQFKALSIDGIIFFLARFGDSPWIDAPYNSHIGYGKLEHAEEGLGLALHILLIDSSAGVLVAQRLIGLSTDFTNSFAELVALQPNFSGDQEYYARLGSIYQRYTTLDMVEMGGLNNKGGSL